jgi:MFS family permease
MFASLGSRNFRLFFAGQLVSQVGNYMSVLVQTLLVLALTKSGTAVGILTACQFLPMLLLGAWAGLVVDRCDKRRLLLSVEALAMVQSFALATLAFQAHPPLAGIFALAFTSGLLITFDNPARRSFVAELVPETEVQNAVSLSTALMTSARVVGPALGGILIATSGFGWCFALDGLSYVAVLLALWRIDSSEVRRPARVERAKGQVRAGFRHVRSVPVLRVSFVMIAIVGCLTLNFNVVLPLLVTRTLHGTPTQFCALYAVMSAGSVVGALAMARRHDVKLRHVIVAAVAWGAVMMAMAAVPNLTAAFPVAALLGATSVGFTTSGTALVQVRADPLMRGRVLSLQAVLLLGSTPIGGPAIGVVCDAFGARAGLGVGAVAALGAGLWGGLMRRQLSRNASPSADVAPAVLQPKP